MADKYENVAVATMR